jgi:hypothetical protein
MAMTVAGGYLSWYQLLDHTTGSDYPPSTLRHALRAYLDAAGPDTGIVGRIAALFSARHAVPSPKGFSRHYRAFLRLEIQREAARQHGGQGSLQERVFANQEGLEQSRRKIIRKEKNGVLAGKFSYLVFYDNKGAPRHSMAALRAATLALKCIYFSSSSPLSLPSLLPLPSSPSSPSSPT